MSITVEQIQSLVGDWVGDIRGSTFANAFATTSFNNNELLLEITFREGTAVATLVGRIPTTLSVPGDIDLHYSAVDGAPAPSDTPTVSLNIQRLDVSEISGRWLSTSGERGVARFAKVVEQVGTVPSSGSSSAPLNIRPPEMVSREIPVGTITLFKNELKAVVEKLESTMPDSSRAVVVGTIDGKKVHQFADDFLRRADLPPRLNELQLNIVDGNHSIQRTITINLNKNGNNNLFVQSGDATWTTGVSNDISAFMSRYSSVGLNFFKTHGLNLNGIIFIGAIAIVPSFPIIERFLFLFSVLMLLLIFALIHKKIQHTNIYLDNTERGRISKEFPALIVTVLGASIIGVIGWIVDLLSKLDVRALLSAIGL